MQNSSWRLGYILVLCPVKGTRLDAWFSATTAKALRQAGIALPDDHMQRNLAPWPYLAFQVSTICLAGRGDWECDYGYYWKFLPWECKGFLLCCRRVRKCSVTIELHFL